MDAKSYVRTLHFRIVCYFEIVGPIIVMLIAVLALGLLSTPAHAQFSPDIQVRFSEGTDVDPPTDALSSSGLLSSVESITRLFSLPTSRLDELRQAGETGSGDSLPDLNMWFALELVDGTDVDEFLEDLKALPNVDEAELAPIPQPLTAVTPDFTADQDYLGPATDGIDATFSSTLTGGDGSGTTIYDVEYSWNQNHEDLSKAAGVSLLLDPGDSASDPFNDTNHGTAVLGELIADDNTIGVTGIVPGAHIGLAPANTTNLGYNPANAILLAVDDAEPGDVILIEQQYWVCGTGYYGPLEWIQSVFDAIQVAVANRIVVVEAAGNGGVDLDQAGCNNRFDRTNRDSGAIIVGAGGSPLGNDRRRLGFSSYGSRVDVQGWGEDVVTTGYGPAPPPALPRGYRDPDDPDDPDSWYTFRFGGTSSASPIVAGAVASLQGIALEQFKTPILPFQMRKLLVDTGSPQLGNVAEHIGPRPDLRAAIAEITQGALDVFFLVDLSGSFTDDLPIFQAQAPGIISNIQALNINSYFGLGRFEDYPIYPFGSAADGDVAYERLLEIGATLPGLNNAESMLNLIGNLTTRSGLDLPQSQLVALYQACTGAGQDLSGVGYPGASIPSDQEANFRNGATKLFLMYTDAAFHLPNDPGDIPYPGPTFVETVAAIEALDPPMVLGISIDPHDGLDDLREMAAATNSFAPEGGLDCDGDGVVDVAAGDPMVCLISEFGAGIGDTIVNIVEAAIEAVSPVAKCKDMEVFTDPGMCTADVSVDDGSYDPDGGPVELIQTPASPYPLGETLVTLRVYDESGLADTCTANVTVTDNTPPVISCNALSTIIPPDAPISFTATATDNCEVSSVEITDYDCYFLNPSGKKVDKTKSCVVEVEGDTITILDSGGVGDIITWNVIATDNSGNTSTTGCMVDVVKPGQ